MLTIINICFPLIVSSWLAPAGFLQLGATIIYTFAARKTRRSTCHQPFWIFLSFFNLSKIEKISFFVERVKRINPYPILFNNFTTEKWNVCRWHEIAWKKGGNFIGINYSTRFITIDLESIESRSRIGTRF